MHEHRCGPGCEAAEYVAGLAIKRLRLNEPRVIPVKTWCRICGVPVLLEVLNDYDQAVRHFYALDDTPMVHKSVHAEQGGWGVSWRLDDVLNVLFLQEHREELWPMAPWWRAQYGEPKSEGQGILVMTKHDLSEYRDRYMDLELRMLDRYINDNPRHITALELDYEEIWGEDDVGERFEIYGYKPPFAIAVDKVTGDKGSLIFQNSPRYYFGWSPERII
jgi:hypothetical protein